MNAPTIAVPAGELEQVRQLLAEVSAELAAAKALRRLAQPPEHACDSDSCLADARRARARERWA